MFPSNGHTHSDVVATSICCSFSELVEELPVRPGERSDDDVDLETNSYVLRKTVMPAVLVEAGLFTIWQGAKFLSLPAGSDRIARAKFLGLLPFLGRSASLV